MNQHRTAASGKGRGCGGCAGSAPQTVPRNTGAAGTVLSQGARCLRHLLWITGAVLGRRGDVEGRWGLESQQL